MVDMSNQINAIRTTSNHPVAEPPNYYKYCTSIAVAEDRVGSAKVETRFFPEVDMQILSELILINADPAVTDRPGVFVTFATNDEGEERSLGELPTRRRTLAGALDMHNVIVGVLRISPNYPTSSAA